MSYIDIAVIAFFALGLLFGLMGKAPKKIISLIFVIAGFAVAYAFCDKIADKLLALDSGMLSIVGIGEAGVNLGDAFTNYVNGFLSKMNLPEAVSGSLNVVIAGALRLVVFWLSALVLMIVAGILGKIIGGVLCHRAKKHSAKKTLGLFGAVKGLLFAVVLILPVVVLAPVVPTVKGFVSDNQLVAQLDEQVSSSKVIPLCDKILSKGDYKFLKFEADNGKGGKEETDLYQFVKAVGGAGKFAKLFDGSDPLRSMSEMSDDELREALTSLDNSDFVKDVIEDMLPSGIQIDIGAIDFSAEAETLIVVKNLVSVDEQGKVEFKSDVNTQTLAEAMANSDLVEVLADSSRGLLADMDSSVKNDVSSKLQQMVGTGEGQISQEKYETLMKLFG